MSILHGGVRCISLRVNNWKPIRIEISHDFYVFIQLTEEILDTSGTGLAGSDYKT